MSLLEEESLYNAYCIRCGNLCVVTTNNCHRCGGRIVFSKPEGFWFTRSEVEAIYHMIRFRVPYDKLEEVVIERIKQITNPPQT